MKPTCQGIQLLGESVQIDGKGDGISTSRSSALARLWAVSQASPIRRIRVDKLLGCARPVELYLCNQKAELHPPEGVESDADFGAHTHVKKPPTAPNSN